jgi:ABC-type sugar transport system substrate-binding protein
MQSLTMSVAAVSLVSTAAAPAFASDPPGKGLVVNMQMGGTAGNGSTLARQTGAKEAADALGVHLNAQFGGWAPETMVDQFKQALAAKPNCIVTMGHPGADALEGLVKQATDQGIVAFGFVSFSHDNRDPPMTPNAYLPQPTRYDDMPTVVAARADSCSPAISLRRWPGAAIPGP